ncbi:glutamine--tRNA ligase/YqeY domain fusion protein [Desulfuribacillus alkaliarsenatis]|uniref:Glutamine--tRNA ligase n=1 Tax=Desulfuribacillus alkaliarsenatis TaxID=766136 RepID=A0A1E5G3G5_9FIRM|nr:glutamine--tRNA ligase/YqeY domain fusion protein [Desulfuribacillus alkaliarsenatis]OEF97510.1 glutamine--tRNA ligase [Desulfuribacillus alkaliarsenatis]
MSSNEQVQTPVNFIQNIITEDLKSGKNNGRVHTRFPPEPNGYLHIGHAKSICLNFGLANANNGLCNLRMDDTNPTKEDEEFVESIKADVKWLGYDWQDRMYFASDYFEKLYSYAVQLIKAGKAYVCELSAEEMREFRGTLTEPGKESPYRNRTPEENLDLFERMRKGEFPNGAKVLRAKIDMSSGNINMRDPVIYRIMHAKHHRTGDAWCIYPMYDFAHPLSDAIENITHSICTLEFADHRPLYDWLVENVDYSNEADGRPHQYEFARLNLSYTVMSKRKLKLLVEEGHVTGWDDPRMPTISGLRRRGYTPESIRDFCDRIGVAKASNLVDKALLEHCIREDLNKNATRAMAVLRPLKLVLDNYPEDHEELLEIENNTEQEDAGKRKVPFSRVLYIEQDDFLEDPPKKFFRLAPGKEVRLKGAYIIQCNEVIKDEQTGEIIELRCSYDPETRSGLPGSARKVKGVLHWVSAKHAVPAQVRLYEELFTKEQPEQLDSDDDGDFRANINQNSLEVIENCLVEPALAEATVNDRFQFMRQGYFCLDSKDTSTDKLVFNRIVSLKDSWGKMK